MTIPQRIYLTLGVSLWLSMLSLLGLFIAVAIHIHALHIPQGQWAGSDSIEIFAYLGLMWVIKRC